MHSRILYKQWKCYGYFIEIRFKKNILNYIDQSQTDQFHYIRKVLSLFII